MANPYKELFHAPGTLAFSLSGLIARLPISMAGIGIITMISQIHGSYWLAGAVAATFTLSTALIAPQISRLTDRYGQGRILPFATAISVLGMLLLLACVHLAAPDWTLFLFAALGGFMPACPPWSERAGHTSTKASLPCTPLTHWSLCWMKSVSSLGLLSPSVSAWLCRPSPGRSRQR